MRARTLPPTPPADPASARRRPATPPVAPSPARPPKEGRPGLAPRILRRCRTERRIGAAAAGGVVVASALGSGWLTPRGPVTTAQALVTLTAGLVVGLLAALLTGSRWTVLAAPAVFAVVVEVVRVGAEGPTVDAPHLASTYGLMAFALGRGFAALLTLLPMAVGAVLGAALARRLDGRRESGGGWSRAGRYGRRTLTALVCLALVALAGALARPGRTEPLLGADGRELAGSVSELTRVEIGGHDLGLMIRGRDADAPVLLYLAGGPGGSELGAMRRHASELEHDFVVATFDQRGTGRSHDQLEPTDTLTLERAVDDVLEVTAYLRDRFDVDQVYLVGQSWGATLGVLAVQADPSAYLAFVGVGQMVSQRETDRLFYADTLAWARERGDVALVDRLGAIGPPPYDAVLSYETALSYEHEVYPYDHSRNSEGDGGFSENLLVEEYSLLEQVHALGGFLDVFAVLYPQLQQIDFRTDAVRLEVPVYLVQGRHEARGRAVLARGWFRMLQAPHKEWITFATSGHRPIFEQPDLFHEVMVDSVLADTQPSNL